MTLKSFIRKSANVPLRQLGVEIQRRPAPMPEEEGRIPEPQEVVETKEPELDLSPYRWLINQKIKTVLDIGANTGQFAELIHKIIPAANIISFEPLKDCFVELEKNGKKFGKFEAYNFALGDERGEVPIYRSEFSPSSSLLPMGNLHKEAYPFTKRGTVEKIKVKRLDEFKNLNISFPMLVKIDVQGFEDKVIDGGGKIISKAQVLIVETSFQVLYEGQPMFEDIYQRLTKLGFTYHGNWFQDNDGRDGAALQADAIFIKPETARKYANRTKA